MARTLAVPAHAPIPCRKRQAINMVRLVAMAQAIEAAANRASPPISGRRRPNRSPSVPSGICASASPRKKADRVRCTAPLSAAIARAMPGMAGR